METNVKNNGTAKNNNTVKGLNPVTEDNKKIAFVHNNPVNELANKVSEEQQPKAEAPKAEAKAEPKAEVKAELAKPVRNLEETIKFLEEMHDRKIKRDRFLATIKNLDEFEIDLKKDADDTDGNYYNGCILTIQDDNGKKFTTKNPVIIWTVAQQVTSICESKLAEVEAGLVIIA